MEKSYGCNKMEKLFNTEFEFSLRILLLLNIFESYLTQDVIRDFDLLITYGKEFNITDANLHGDKSYSISELETRHKLIKISLKNLVKRNLVIVETTKNGFRYKISSEGIMLCKSFYSDYSKEYIKEALKVKEFTKNMTEKELHQFTYKQGLRRDE